MDCKQDDIDVKADVKSSNVDVNVDVDVKQDVKQDTKLTSIKKYGKRKSNSKCDKNLTPNNRFTDLLKSRRSVMRQKGFERLHNSLGAAPSWWNHEYLKVGYSPNKGRYVYTIQDIPKGTTILSEDPIKSKSKSKLNSMVNEDPRCCELYGGQSQCIDNNAFYARGHYCLYLMGSIFAHCCQPNTKVSKNDFITLEDIKAGGELTISYMGEDITNFSKRARSEKLSNWFKKCKCSACLK